MSLTVVSSTFSNSAGDGIVMKLSFLEVVGFFIILNFIFCDMERLL